MTVQSGLGRIVNWVVGLLVLFIVVFVTWKLSTPLINDLAEKIDKVLDLGLSAKSFDEYKDEAEVAVASSNALLYSINRLAWYDSLHNYLDERNDPVLYKTFLDQDYKEIKTMKKKFLNSEAIPIQELSEKVEIMEDYTKNIVLGEMTQKILDCVKIYNDLGQENTGCFAFDFTKNNEEISYKDLKNFVKDNIDSYDNDDKKVLKDVFGIGLLRSENVVFSVEDSIIQNQRDVKICVQKPIVLKDSKILKKFKIYITDNDEVGSEICVFPDEQLHYGMKVKNFHLPQKIDETIGIVDYASKHIGKFGDPDYIIYYEIFPEGEDRYWHPAAFVVDIAKILTIEGIFLAIDLIPYVGKAVSGIMEETGLKATIKEGVESLGEKLVGKTGVNAVNTAVSSTKNIFSKMKKILIDLPSEAFSNLFRGAKERLAAGLIEREIFAGATEEIGEKLIKEGVQNADSSALSKLLKEDMSVLYDLFLEEGIEVVGKNGELTEEFTKELLEFFSITLAKEGGEEITEELAKQIAQDTVKELSERMVLSSTKTMIRRLMRLAGDSNNILVKKFREVWQDVTLPREEKEKIIRTLTEKGKFIEELSPAQMRKLTSNTESAIRYALDLQELNHEFAEEICDQAFLSSATAKEIIGEGFQKENLKDLSRDQMRDLLDLRFEEAMKDIPMSAKFFGKMQSFLLPWKKKRHILTALAVYSNALENSIGEKFVPVGTNSIGFRTPFLATEIYDDEFTVNFNYMNVYDKDDYKNFFNHYAGYDPESGEVNKEESSRFRGLLPEVNRYFLALVKDKGTIREQPNQRLHLVSPCKADLIITKTKCECWGSPREDTTGTLPLPELIAPIFEHDGIYETDTYNEYFDEVIESFDGESKMLYTIGSNGVLLKQCYPKRIKDHITFWREDLYKPSCIEINPVLDEDEKYNYCYHGLKDEWLIVADVGLNWALPIGGTFLCAGTGP
jgi:hypothetical protein